MVWRKAWLDTRMRFLVGLAVLVLIAIGTVLEWPYLVAMVSKMTMTVTAGSSGAVAAAVDKALEAQKTFRGYIWFGGSFKNVMHLFAVLLGSGSVLSTSGRGMLFSLALPVPRGRWIAARAALGLAELFVLALVPSFVVPLFAPAVNESYSFGDAAVFGLLAFVVGCVLYAFAMLASAIFDELWRALLLTLVVWIALGFAEVGLWAGNGPLAAMSGRAYFYGGTLPWLGLIVSAGLTLALLYAAAVRLARRDF